MKSICILISALFLSSPLYAGSANCTNSREINSGFDGLLDSSDCIIVVNIPTASMDYVRGYLPLPINATAGDEFTLKDTSPYLTDSYEDPDTHEIIYYNYTGGVGLEELFPGDSNWSFSPNRYVKAVFNGSYWVFSDGDL